MCGDSELFNNLNYWIRHNKFFKAQTQTTFSSFFFNYSLLLHENK